MDNTPALTTSTSRRDRGLKRTALLSAVALVGSLGVSLAVAAPASATTLTGVVRADRESPNTSATAKSVTVNCPADTKVINAGGYITDGNGSVAMDDIFPNETLTSVTVTGKETDSYSTRWRVRAFATCADEPAGLEWNWVESDEDSDDWKRAEAECTEGKTLLGTGATIRGGQGEAAVDLIAPNGGPGVAPDKVTVDAFELDSFAGDWTVNAFAICADPLDGQQRLETQTVDGSANNGTAAFCDPGQVATGTGVEIVGVFGEVVIDDAYPTDGSLTTAPTGTTVYGQEEDGTTGTWRIEAEVICADA